MCLLSMKKFQRGWHCVLIDKEAAGDAFPVVKKDLDALPYRDQREYIFRLTVWRSKKDPNRHPRGVEGQAIFVKEVNDLKEYHDVYEGVADMDDFIKTEGESASKKTGKKNKKGDANDTQDADTQEPEKNPAKKVKPCAAYGTPGAAEKKTD